MIPILEAIPNGVSALPAATSAGAASSAVQPGGFAAMVAAAQSLSTAAPSRSEDEVQASSGSVAGNAGAAANLKGPIPGSGISQLKKFLNNGLVAANLAGNPGSALNIVVPGFIPATAIPVAAIPAPSSSSQPGHLVPAAGLPTGLPLTAIAAVQTQTQEVLAGTVNTGSPTGAQDAALTGTSFDRLTHLPAPGVLISTLAGPANTQKASPEASTVNGELASAEPALLAGSAPSVHSPLTGQLASDHILPDVIPGSQPSGAKNGMGSAEPTALAANTFAVALSTTDSQGAPAKVSPNVAAGNQWSTSGTTSPASTAAVVTPETSPVAEVMAPGPTLPGPTLPGPTLPGPTLPGPTLLGPTLLAKANSEAGAAAPVPLSFAANLKTGQTSSANDIVPDNTVPSNASAQPTTVNSLSAIITGQLSASADLNPAAATVLGGPPLQFAVPKIKAAVTSPSVRGTGAMRASTPSAALPAGSGSDSESQTANQTPFSVFFSGPGPGTESAASALPKMILPATGSAVRDSDTSNANAASASPKAGGLPSGGGPSSGLQNPTPPNLKDSISAPASGGPQTAQASHREADLSPASLQLAASQSGAAPTPAPPASAAATIAPGTPPVLANDLLPKPDQLPAGGPATPANTVPAPAETLTVALPGPVQVAQLVDRMGQSEMRIGMNTSAFGSVEVRTVVHANDVGLVIGSEKGDLRTLLANDLPAITNTLQQQNLRLNSVNFMQGFAFSNNSSGGGNAQQRSFVPLRAAAGPGLSEAEGEDAVDLGLAGEFGSAGSLSILA